MTLHTLPLGGPTLTGLRLRPNAVAVPALSSHVRPGARPRREGEPRPARRGAPAATCPRVGSTAPPPSASRSGTSPWESADAPGAAVQLGSVDWSYDTPVKHYVTIYRAMVTVRRRRGRREHAVRAAPVLGLTGIPVDGARVTMPAPPARDPFRRPA